MVSLSFHTSQAAFTCSELTIETFFVNFEHFTPCSSVSVVNFEIEIAGWDVG